MRRLVSVVGTITILLIVSCGSTERKTSSGGKAHAPGVAPACPSATRASSTTTSPSKAPESVQPRFVPRTYREGPRVVMPVTFPDGSTAEVVYESSLDLASALVVPYWAATVTVGAGDSKDLLFRYGSIADFWGQHELVSAEPAAGGRTACVYRVDAPLNHDFLVLGFDNWTVAVHSAEGMSPEVRQAWAMRLTAQLSPDGFPVLGTTGGMDFTAIGGRGGPELQFQKGGPGIGLVLRGCGPDEQQYQSGELAGYGIRCLPGTGIRMSVGGYAGVSVNEALQGVDVRNVVLAAAR